MMLMLMMNYRSSFSTGWKLKGSKYKHAFNITDSSHVAQTILMDRGYHSASNNHTLAVMILYTYGLNMHNSRQLNCALKLLHDNLGYKTPLHIYLWLGDYYYHNTTLPYWLTKMRNIIVMQIDPSSWQVPDFLGPQDLWIPTPPDPYTSTNYYLMGRWRLTFQFEFIKSMNYRYFLQVNSICVYLDILFSYIIIIIIIIKI